MTKDHIEEAISDSVSGSVSTERALDIALEALKKLYGVLTVEEIEPVGKAITAIKQARALDKKAENARELGLDYEPVLQDIEQYRLQMAGISTAAIGYWKESDGIHPDYDTIALRDVAKLYAKYDELYRAQRTWVGLTDEEILKLAYPIRWQEVDDFEADKAVNFAQIVEAKFKEKNT